MSTAEHPSYAGVLSATDAEGELLLRCTRSRSSPANSARVRELLSAAIDWETLWARAADQGVLAVVAWSLHGAYGESVPDPVRQRARNVVASAGTAHERMAVGLAELARVLVDRDVAVAVLKGPPFASLYFADAAARMCRDLDLLVSPGRLRAAGEALAAAGFSPHLHGDRLGRPARHRKPVNPCLFLRQADGLYVDLHTVVGKPRLGARVVNDTFWGRCQTVALDGRAVRVPHTHDTLLYLCLHGVQHRWRGLRFVADIHELIEGSPDMAWPELRTQAREERRERVLRHALLVTHALFETALPDECLAWAEGDERAAAMADQTLSHLLGRLRGAATPPLSRFVELRTLEGVGRGTRWLLCYARDILTPCDLDEAVIRLPRVFSPLYYPIRAARLTGKYLHRKLRRP